MFERNCKVKWKDDLCIANLQVRWKLKYLLQQKISLWWKIQVEWNFQLKNQVERNFQLKLQNEIKLLKTKVYEGKFNWIEIFGWIYKVKLKDEMQTANEMENEEVSST